MAVQLKPEQEQRLREAALRLGVTPEEMMDRFFDHLDGLAAELREGEESAEREGWLTNEEVFERLNRRLVKTA
jgi:predicted transcriptional regulator